MRRILALTLAASAMIPGAARADAVATAFALRYIPQTITIEVGERLDFLNADPASLTDGHDITHDMPAEHRLFASDTVLVGTLTPVEGVELLDVGLYPYFCTRHSSMRGTLEVVVTY